MSISQIRLGSSNPLVFYPPEDDAPVEAQLTCTDANLNPLPGTWPQTVPRDTASANVTGSQAARVLTASSVSGFVAGETYLLSLPDGRRFRCRLAGVGSGALQLDQPLPVAVPNGATLTGLAYGFTTSPTLTDLVRRRCRARWEYSVGGVALLHQQRFDVVREPWRLLLTETDLERFDHTFGETAGSSGRWMTLVEGVSDDLARWLEARGLYADLLKDRDQIKRAAALGTLARFYGARPGADAQHLGNKWTKAYEAALVELADARNWYDADDDDRLDGEPDPSRLREDDEDTARRETELGLSANYALVG